MDNNKNDSASSEQADAALDINMVNQIVNQAISSRFKSFEKKFEEFANKLAPQTQEEAKPEKLSNVELVQLKKQLDQMRAEKDAEVSKRKESELHTQVKEQLLQAGVAPNMIKAAMAMLIDSDKTIAYDEDDQIVFKHQNGPLDVTNGIKAWAKSEEGKYFLSPKGIQGSGQGSMNKSNFNNTNKPISKDEAGEALEQLLFGLNQ